MNYKEYLALKRSCGIKIRLFSVAIYVISVIAIVQTYFLIMKVNYSLDVFNMYLLDILFTQGQDKLALGNSIYGYIFFAVYAFIVLTFLFACVMTFMSKRFPYVLAFTIYLFDAFVCVMIGQYYPALIHLVLLICIFFAIRNRSYMNMLKNNVWGYD